MKYYISKDTKNNAYYFDTILNGDIFEVDDDIFYVEITKKDADDLISEVNMNNEARLADGRFSIGDYSQYYDNQHCFNFIESLFDRYMGYRQSNDITINWNINNKVNTMNDVFDLI